MFEVPWLKLTFIKILFVFKIIYYIEVRYDLIYTESAIKSQPTNLSPPAYQSESITQACGQGGVLHNS